MATEPFYNPDIPAADAKNPDWLLGYTASDPKSADTPDSNMRYFGPGEASVRYKQVWKGRPCAFPNGEGDDGSL